MFVLTVTRGAEGEENDKVALFRRSSRYSMRQPPLQARECSSTGSQQPHHYIRASSRSRLAPWHQSESVEHAVEPSSRRMPLHPRPPLLRHPHAQIEATSTESNSSPAAMPAADLLPYPSPRRPILRHPHAQVQARATEGYSRVDASPPAELLPYQSHSVFAAYKGCVCMLPEELQARIEAQMEDATKEAILEHHGARSRTSFSHGQARTLAASPRKPRPMRAISKDHPQRTHRHAGFQPTMVQPHAPDRNDSISVRAFSLPTSTSRKMEVLLKHGVHQQSAMQLCNSVEVELNDGRMAAFTALCPVGATLRSPAHAASTASSTVDTDLIAHNLLQFITVHA